MDRQSIVTDVHTRRQVSLCIALVCVLWIIFSSSARNVQCCVRVLRRAKVTYGGRLVSLVLVTYTLAKTVVRFDQMRNSQMLVSYGAQK